jgi:hypothetical protein
VPVDGRRREVLRVCGDETDLGPEPYVDCSTGDASSAAPRCALGTSSCASAAAAYAERPPMPLPAGVSTR